MFSTVTFAQLSQITNGNLQNVTPIFVYQGNLYAHAYVEISNEQYGWKQFIINPNTQTATALQLSDELGSFNYAMWQLLANCGNDCNYQSGGFSPNYYNNEVYLNNFAIGYDNLKLDTQNNMVTIDGLGYGYGHLFNNKLYYGSLYKYKDLSSGDFVINPNPSNSFNGRDAINVNNKMIVPVIYTNDEGGQYLHITRLDGDYSNGTNGILQQINLTLEYDIMQMMTFGQFKKPVLINNKLLYMTNNMNGSLDKIISFDTNDIEYNNLNVLSFDMSTNYGFDYILLNDGIIFLRKQYNSETNQYTYHWYKTNGINNAVPLDNMPITGNSGAFYLNYWFKTYSETNDYLSTANGIGGNGGIGNSFVTIGNTTYFSTVNPDTIECKLWKMTSINSTPELIHTYTGSMLTSRNSIFYATEWQGNLIFLNGEDGLIYRYNGTELIVDPDLNILNPNGRSMDEMQVYGIIPFENNIIITTNEGAYSIYGGTLSHAKQELSKLKIYPNPVSETLNFSESLKDITVYDLTGRTINSFTGNQDKIDVSNLSNGNYILKGETLIGNFITKQFIKN